MNIKEQEEKLMLGGAMLEATYNWWAREIQMRISKFQFLQEKLIEKWDDKMAQECSELQVAINHLQKKSEWEQRESNKFSEQRNNFIKLKNKDIKKTLSSKLAAKLRQNQI